jgi:hypothetical protein
LEHCGVVESTPLLLAASLFPSFFAPVQNLRFRHGHLRPAPMTKTVPSHLSPPASGRFGHAVPESSPFFVPHTRTTLQCSIYSRCAPRRIQSWTTGLHRTLACFGSPFLPTLHARPSIFFLYKPCIRPGGHLCICCFTLRLGSLGFPDPGRLARLPFLARMI